MNTLSESQRAGQEPAASLPPTGPDVDDPSQPPPYLVIQPKSGLIALDIREIWSFRDLFATLAGRDLKLRYKQTSLGVIWVVLQPLMAAGVFAFVFGSVAKLPSGGMPYLVFSFAGLLGWNFFNNVLTKVGACLVGNSQLISKVYFPRLILPLSNIGSSLVDFAVAGAMMIILLAVYRIVPSASVVLLPLWLGLLAAVAMGLGLCTAALAVSYRDVQYILPVFTNILLYASPVAYSLAAVPPSMRWVYELNPLTPPLEAMRASLLGTALPSWQSLSVSAAIAGGSLLLGLYFFKWMERSFADVI